MTGGWKPQEGGNHGVTTEGGNDRRVETTGRVETTEGRNHREDVKRQRVETTEGRNHGKGETTEGWKPWSHHRGWE